MPLGDRPIKGEEIKQFASHYTIAYMWALNNDTKLTKHLEEKAELKEKEIHRLVPSERVIESIMDDILPPINKQNKSFAKDVYNMLYDGSLNNHDLKKLGNIKKFLGEI